MQIHKPYLILLILIVFSGGTNGKDPEPEPEAEPEPEGDIPDSREAICDEFKGAYVRLSNLGIVCCGNETLNLPLELSEDMGSNTQLADCAKESSHYDDVELPTELWKVLLCVLKNASTFEEDKITFQSYLKFLTIGYPNAMKKKIETATDKCRKDGESEKDNLTKLQKFTECFHKSENDVCHLPYGSSPRIEVSNKLDPKYECPGMEGIYGIDRVDYCCKKQSVPFNFLSFYVDFPQDDFDKDRAENCSQSFVDKQLELDPALKKAVESLNDDENNLNSTDESYIAAAAKLEKCIMACEIRKTNFGAVSELKIDYEGTVSAMILDFGKKIQKDLNKILMERKSSFQFKMENRTLSYDELKKEFDGANEISKIVFYCKFATEVVAEVERSLQEYCFDKSLADQWFKEKHF